MSGEAYDVNKQTIYTVLKSTNELTVQYSPGMGQKDCGNFSQCSEPHQSTELPLKFVKGKR